MASFGNEMERWAPKEAAEPMGPVTPPENGTRLSPAEPPSGAGAVSRLPGKAASAGGSFPGSSSLPEHVVPLRCSEQAPYMDSGYVRGVYSPGAARSEPAHLCRPSDPGSRGDCPGVCPAERHRNAAQAPPPSPPTRLDSYKVTRHLENMAGRCSPGRQRECRTRPAPCGQDGPLEGRDRPWSPGRRETSEQDTVAAGRKVLEYKDMHTSELKNGLSKSQNQGLKTRENGEQSLSQQPVKRSNPHVFSRPSSFIFQEYLKTDSMASAPKILSAFNSVHAYKIPEEMNATAYPLPHTNPNTVNDIQENKQYHCVVHKPNFREADPQSTVPEPGPRRRSLPHARCPVHAELHEDLGQDVFEDNHDLKRMENTLLIKAASKKLSSCTDEYECCDSEGEMRNGVWDQQAKMQKSSVSSSLGSLEAEYPHCGDLHQGNKQCCDHTNQTAFFRPKENATSHILNEFNKEKQANNTSPDFAMHLEQEKTAPSVCLHKHQPALQNQPERHLQGDLASEQINRQTTPLLYYLSGGKTTNLLHQRKHTQLQEDLRSLPKKSSTSNYSASAQSTDVQRESNHLPKPKPNHQCIANDLSEAQDVILGSPGSSVEESFKNDYREQLKVAQKKVLRETSFKRKDLQMSLPIRLRKKPSQRSSIEHLRSFSLSSANEVAKLVPGPPPHLQLVEHFSKDEEIKRTQLGRIGGRKRVTKEQKKMCFSEPEKLNQLEDKDVSWSQVRDEITEPDTVTAGRKPLENRGRALSSSAISKTELKQIQQTALIEYMERKISQRPGSSQHIPAPNPPVQKRPSYPKWPSGKVPNPNKSRRSQNTEVLGQGFSEEEFPEVFAPVAPATAPSVTCGCSPSAAAAAGVSPQRPPRPRGTDGSCSSSRRCESAESLPRAGTPDGHPATVTAPPPSTQESPGCVSSAAPPARSQDPCPGCPSFHDAEKDECESHEDRDDNVAGSACCQDRKDLSPETSILVPKGGNKEEPQVAEEHRIRSVNGNALMNGPGLQLEAEHPAVPEVKATHCGTAVAAQPHQGANSTADGSEGWVRANGSGSPAAEEASVQSRQHSVLPEEEKPLPETGLLSPEDQRYEELAKEVIAQDSSLADVLMPRPIRKTALDLMEGLFPINISMLDKSHRKRGDVQHVQENEKGNKDLLTESPGAEHDAEQSKGDPVSKGNQALNSSRDSTNDLDDITSKKLELAWRLRCRLRGVRAERELVLREGRECAARGRALHALLRRLCKPNELERYLMFVGDLEKVVSLLLCLSSRLARVQDAMSKVDGNTDAEEKQSLNERHKLLSRQREDAKDLKENLDRRERVVSGILAKYLTHQQLQDYRHFVQTKTSLLIEQKDLEEQIKLLEEQLESLEKSIHL